MLGYHQIIVLGTVGRDPELTVTSDGTPVTKFSMVVNERSKDKEVAHWYAIIAWRQLAETLEQYVVKGSQLLVVGRPNVRTFTTKDGKQGVSNEVTVEKFSFAGGKSKERESVAVGAPVSDDPFLPDYPDNID